MDRNYRRANLIAMSLPRTMTLCALTIAVVAATALMLSTKQSRNAPEQAAFEPTNIGRADAAASPPQQPNSTPTQDTPTAEAERPSVGGPEIRRMLVDALGTWREGSANELAARGLAPEDGERLAQQFVEGAADCLLEATRTDNEGRGKPNGDEMSWTQTMASIGLHRVQAAAMPCVANIAQQAGVPLPANFGNGGSRVDAITPEPPSPPWAADMEARIRGHVASYSAPEVEAVLVKCVEDGCDVSLVGHDIRVFDLEFDVFAEQNEFRHALLRGDRDMRFVWLQR